MRIVAAVLAALLAFGLFTAGADAQRRRRRARSRSRVAVEVVDVVRGRAYLSPGSESGLGPGATVEIARSRYRVVGATASYAVIETRAGRLRPGLRGVAVRRSRSDADEEVRRLPAPRSLAEFRGQWPEAELPAASQRPRHVPLGVVRDDRMVHATISAGGGAIVPLGDGGDVLGTAELRARVLAEPFRELPVTLDAEAAVRTWLGAGDRDGGSSRPALFVRALQLAYGQDAGLYAALGRLRYAASSLGMLDGVRVSTPSLGGLTVGAFGGFVPSPLDGKPAFDASRFGAEIAYRDPESTLRPMVSVVGHASRFEGELDERRVTARASAFPGDARVGGHVEVSLFDAENQWGAEEIEVTAAGIDGGVRLGDARLGARIDLRRPDRSRWLASFLPPAWLCDPVDALDPGECIDDRIRYLATVDAGVSLGNVDLSGGATAIQIEGANELDQLAGFAQARILRLAGTARAELGLSASSGAFVDTAAARVGAGATFFDDRLDISLHYRPAYVVYSVGDPFVQHGAGGTASIAVTDELDVTLAADATAGGDVDVLLVRGAAVWRPGM